MEKQELNSIARETLSDPNRYQEFSDTFSLEENWDKVDKENIKVPRGTGLYEDDCPECEKPIRTIFDKFASDDRYFYIICPHCKKKVGCHLEYTGYTSELIFQEYDEEQHG